MAKNKVVQSTKEDWRRFTYKQGNVELTFSLRTDVTTQIVDFLECMNLAKIELEDLLKIIKKK
jgi:hypothetical protein